ncbi:MAG: hypothetical protein JXA52_00780, partial [Planctomycetes bacterium]|nr:hypothetical protein [Planctomycetota bacterium]
MPSLSDSVQFLKGVGPRRAEDFIRLGVSTVRDLLYTFPRRISDRTNFATIADAIQMPGTELSLRVRVLEASSRRIRRGKQLTTVVFEDDTGLVEGLWFNSPWILDQFSGENVLLFGKVTMKGKKAQIVHPRMELVPEGISSGKQVGRMVPIYPQTGLLTQAAWLRIMGPALDQYLPILPELYPEEFLEERQLMARAEAVRNMHFPKSATLKAKARERLVYDECLVMQLGIAMRRYCNIDTHPGRVFKITPKIAKHI